MGDQFDVGVPPAPYGFVQRRQQLRIGRGAVLVTVLRQLPHPGEQFVELLRLHSARRAEPVPEEQEVLPRQRVVQQLQLSFQGAHQPRRPLGAPVVAPPSALPGGDVPQVDQHLAEQGLGRLVHDDEEPFAVTEVLLVDRCQRALEVQQFGEVQIRRIVRGGHRTGSSCSVRAIPGAPGR
nr:hypothetical protein [Streptomyces sp. FXJ7.023]